MPRIIISVRSGVVAVEQQSQDVIEVRDYDNQEDSGDVDEAGESYTVETFYPEVQRGSYCPEHGSFMPLVREDYSRTFYQCPNNECPGWTYDGEQGCYIAGDVVEPPYKGDVELSRKKEEMMSKEISVANSCDACKKPFLSYDRVVVVMMANAVPQDVLATEPTITLHLEEGSITHIYHSGCSTEGE